MSIKFLFPKIFSLAVLLFASVNLLNAQTDENPNVTESGNTITNVPSNDIYERKVIKENKKLEYVHLNERDVLWEKRVWRVIDINEKRNLFFARNDQDTDTDTKALITILLKEGKEGNISAYQDEDFKSPILDMKNFGVRYDSMKLIDPETYEEKDTVVRNEIKPEHIKQYRLKEVWFFDEEDSKFDVRILGIAPIGEIYDEKGDVRSCSPLFWVYYPEVRDVLHKSTAYNEANDANQTSWDDVFQKRLFSSYITKESNVFDRRIQDYKSGMDVFYESNTIKDANFHFEHDLWDY
jgi:gliding motility associated protien GldN